MFLNGDLHLGQNFHIVNFPGWHFSLSVIFWSDFSAGVQGMSNFAFQFYSTGFYLCERSAFMFDAL
jgi:hypothetical protein